MKKILFLLIFFTSFNIFSQVKNCYGSTPIYYTIKVVSLYEDMSANSAISIDIPTGSAVLITNSFFGDTGWWEVCYNGESGWVKKNFLSRKVPQNKKVSIPTQENISAEVDDSDVGFEPFLAKTKSATNFRTAPSTTESQIIKKLKPNSELFIFSRESIEGFYKTIDIQSGKIGWVSASLVHESGKVDIKDSGAFTSTGTTSEYKSTVEITNKSSSNITLIIDNETFYMTPHSTKTVNIYPSKSYYVATAPNVIPASGYQIFESNHSYEWEFWIETKRY